METLLSYFKNHIVISEAIKKELKEITGEKKLKKGETLLLEGSLQKQQVFVTNGCLRSYYTTGSGKDYTIQFAIKNWWIGDYITLPTNQKAILSIESLTNSTVLIIDKNKLEQLYLIHPEFESVQRKNTEVHIATLQKRILGLLSMSATEKYEDFLSTYSEVEQLIPNYQIASYLGVTPESLSRIRKKRMKK